VGLANEGLDYATESVISSALETTEAAAKNPVVDMHLGWSDLKEQPHPYGIVRFLKRLGINRLGNDQGVLFLNGQYLEHSDEKVTICRSAVTCILPPVLILLYCVSHL
jgi:hypothetical protein